jgi:membrane-associated phospholipid phosphatase
VTFWQHAVAASTDALVLGALALLVALHAAHSRSVRDAIRLLAAVLLAWIVANALKLAVGDPRPAGGLVDAWGGGWPSGHAAVGAAAALALWALYAPSEGRMRRLALAAGLAALALALAWTRLYLGVHDLGDLAGGLAVGLLVGYLLRPRR